MMRLLKGLLVLCCVVASFSGVASSRVDSIGRKTVDGKEYIVYMVTAGETIYGISTQYHVPIEELMTINPELENGLKTGQILSIPYKPDLIEKPDAGRKVHVVKPGETLYGLSKEFGVPLNDLLRWNGMELKAGQKIYVSPSQQEAMASKNREPEKEKETANDKKDKKEEAEESTIERIEREERERLEKEKREEGNAKEEVKKEEPDQEKEVAQTEGKTYPKYIPPSSPEWGPTEPTPELGPKTRKRVMIIPFDPYLYFSDADDEIARTSQVHRTKVRQVFRRRLNALLDPQGYETIHLLGGIYKDSLGDLNKIYKGVTYNYQEILDNGSEQSEEFIPPTNKKKKGFGIRIVDQLASSHSKAPTSGARSHRDNRYFGVKIRDPRFFDYFGTKYGIDYYVFINQFEVRTDYQTCLDRSSQNYQRNFLTHFSIFDDKGNQLAGNKITTYYNSNSNNVYKIVKDNLPQVAEQIMQQLPSPGY